MCEKIEASAKEINKSENAEKEMQKIPDSKKEILAPKIENGLNNLSASEREELKNNLEKEIQKISYYEFNNMLNKLNVSDPQNYKPYASLEGTSNEINNNENQDINARLTIQDPQAQKIYGLLYNYHLLSNKTPLLESETMPIILQKTFLSIKTKYLKEKYPQTRAMRNFNPGNLRTQGDLGKDKGNYAIFSSLERGRNALIKSIERRKDGESKIYQPYWNLIQFFKKYADPKGALNYATKAAQIMSKIAGLPISPDKTPIKNIPTEAFATAIAAKEDGNCYRALKNEGFIK